MNKQGREWILAFFVIGICCIIGYSILSTIEMHADATAYCIEQNYSFADTFDSISFSFRPDYQCGKEVLSDSGVGIEYVYSGIIPFETYDGFAQGNYSIGYRVDESGVQ